MYYSFELAWTNFYAYIFSRIQDSKELKNSWINLFHDEDEMKVMENKESIDSIFSEILKKIHQNVISTVSSGIQTTA